MVLEKAKEEDKQFHKDIDTDFLEYETKYSVGEGAVYLFKDLMETSEEVRDFLYVEGDDIYYSKGEAFLRHRLPTKASPRSELTHKSKPKEAINNVARTEVNLKVTKNDLETVKKFTEVLGFKYNFRITKYCHIYYTKDANLVFYSIKDHDGRKVTRDHYIEIEVNEDLATELTKEECKEIIRKWETFLEPLGVKYQKRLYRQLFDIYRKF